LDNIPDIDELFKEYDIITSKPILYKLPVKWHYGRCHNIEDLYIVGGIIADKYPQYSNKYLAQRLRLYADKLSKR
jgi:hypothetical protein